jgi:hypothetical protein
VSPKNDVDVAWLVGSTCEVTLLYVLVVVQLNHDL